MTDIVNRVADRFLAKQGSTPRQVEDARDLPKEPGALISYREGTSLFGSKFWQAIRTTKGWLKAGVNLKGRHYWATVQGPTQLNQDCHSFEVLSEGVKPGGRILHPAQLEGFGPGSVIEGHDKSTWIRQSDGAWAPDAVSEKREKFRREMGVKPSRIESSHFDGEIEQGLKLKKAR